ncbi:hypothetical protein N6H14_33495 [Paenibacillus sp. CC-CFT747]|nr:hypothetical protein N6H14_33495 [Paenibacillus sp. CC-CFT747]
MFSRLAKWTFPQFQASAFEVTSRLEGDEVKLDLKSADPAFQGEIQATVTDEALGITELAAIPTLPGEYEAQVPVRQPGVYLTRIDVQDPADRSKTLGSSTTGFVIPYSPEYRLSAGDQTAKLKQLADMTGGRLLSSEHPEEVFQGAVQAKKQSRDRTRLLLAAAALLWVADIAARRLNVPWSRLAERARRRFGFSDRPVTVPSAPAKMERLGRRKDQAAAFYRSLGSSGRLIKSRVRAS